jgi:TRAP-type mannitol/chloroaromatic compound transport system permease large subunit
VAAISEISRRSSFWDGIFASLPLTSILAILWLWKDTKNTQQIINFSTSVAYIVLPSLVFFITLSLLLGRFSVDFWKALFLSIVTMVLVYYLYLKILTWLGIQL